MSSPRPPSAVAPEVAEDEVAAAAAAHGSVAAAVQRVRPGAAEQPVRAVPPIAGSIRLNTSPSPPRPDAKSTTTPSGRALKLRLS